MSSNLGVGFGGALLDFEVFLFVGPLVQHAQSDQFLLCTTGLTNDPRFMDTAACCGCDPQSNERSFCITRRK